MKLRRNDRDEVGMMILVILNTFPSFLSSQMFGKNVVFLDFIPIIPASFRHSGVIPKFHFNWNDAGMTNDFGLKLTTFPKFRQLLIPMNISQSLGSQIALLWIVRKVQKICK